MELTTPHIPLGISLQEGIEILKGVSSGIQKLVVEREDFYVVSSGDWECGFYARDGIVHSSWYNDSLGRESEEGISTRLALYLARYGNIDDWKDGRNNGGIQFFVNEKSGVGMAYGLHKDVLRFNQLG